MKTMSLYLKIPSAQYTLEQKSSQLISKQIKLLSSNKYFYHNENYANKTDFVITK